MVSSANRFTIYLSYGCINPQTNATTLKYSTAHTKREFRSGFKKTKAYSVERKIFSLLNLEIKF